MKLNKQLKKLTYFFYSNIYILLISGIIGFVISTYLYKPDIQHSSQFTFQGGALEYVEQYTPKRREIQTKFETSNLVKRAFLFNENGINEVCNFREKYVWRDVEIVPSKNDDSISIKLFTDTKENAQSCSDGILSLLINKQTEIYSSMLEEIVKKKNYFKKIIEYPEFGKSLDIPNFLVTEDMLINAQSTYYQLDYLIKNHRYNPPKLLGDFIIRSSPNLKSHFYILGGIFGLFIGVLIGWMRHFYKKNN